jgi:magnesium-transporting ATPase (P-type)
MLTGDKVETAKCIAISTSLKNKKQEMFEIKDPVEPSDKSIIDLLRSLN